MRFLKPIQSRREPPFDRGGFATLTVLLSFVLVGGLNHVGASEFLIQTWDSSSGLPQNTVRAITQTADGYLWIGTENGLARFDGVRFENFTREKIPALPNPNVLSLQLAASGSLWVGNSDHTSLWDGRRLVEQDWPLTAGDAMDRRLSSTPTNCVFSTVLGGVIRGELTPAGHWRWTGSPPVGTSVFAEDGRGEIWRLVTGDGRLSRLTERQAQPVTVGAAAGRITVLTVDAAGQVWLGTEHQLLRQEGGAFVPVPPPAGQRDLAVTELFATRDGALWVMAGDHLWKRQNNEWVMDAGAWPFHQLPLTKLIEDRNGSVWFSYYGAGLVRLDRNGRRLTLSTRDGLPGDRVRCFFQDREGNFWVGIDRGGLVRLREKQFQVVGTDEGLSDPVVLGICEDAEGALWAGTYGGGLDRWAEGKCTVFNLGPDGSRGYVFTVFPDRQGRLWVGTRDNGVFIRDHGEFRHPFSNNAIPASVHAIFQDRAGNVWLGSSAGVYRWRDGQLEHFAADTELAGADVRAFAEDAAGGLWMGTQGNGLHRFQGGQHLALHVADGLPDEFVRSLFTDREGTLWIGLFDSALFRWRDGRLSRAVPARGLPGDVICDFEEDDRGQLWLSTGLGLIRMAKSDLNAFADGREKRVPFVTYGRFDGLPTVDFSGGVQRAGWPAHDGSLWFATSKGLVSFQPASLTINPLPPSVVVESLLVDGALFASATDKGPEVQDLSRVLRVPAGRTQLEFQFAGLSLTASDKVRFQYRLEGLQADWQDAGMNRFVTFNYLPPGKYKFRVRAANNDGVWNETGAVIGFELQPHFWQRSWFRASVVLAIIGAAWLAYYLRMARLLELERLRLRIARDLHDDVGANLASMALIAEAMEKQPTFGDPADLRVIALHTIDSLRDIVWFIDPARDRLGDLVVRMRDTAPLLLTGLKQEFEAIVPNPDLPLPPAFRRNVFPIFKEALHNAVSHARANRVSIRLDCRHGVLRLQVQDDGIGFDEPTITPGNGLRNLRRRAAEMHGAVRIHTAAGRGTTVEFEAPFPRMRGFHFKALRVTSPDSMSKPHRENPESNQ